MSSQNTAPPPSRPPQIPATYITYETPDPHEDHTGPFWFDPESRRSAFVVSSRATNSQGSTHGGALLTFADFSLFVIALEHTAVAGYTYVTISLSSDIVAASREGDLIESEGEVVRATRDKDLVFVRVRVFSGTRTLLTGQGIIKRVVPRATGNRTLLPAPTVATENVVRYAEAETGAVRSAVPVVGMWCGDYTTCGLVEGVLNGEVEAAAEGAAEEKEEHNLSRKLQHRVEFQHILSLL